MLNLLKKSVSLDIQKTSNNSGRKLGIYDILNFSLFNKAFDKFEVSRNLRHLTGKNSEIIYACNVKLSQFLNQVLFG